MLSDQRFRALSFNARAVSPKPEGVGRVHAREILGLMS